jgi:hypothetical protein
MAENAVAVQRDDGGTHSLWGLSTGEKEVVSLAFDGDLWQRDTLFLVDEPDAHLHPSTQSDLIAYLRGIIPSEAFLLVTTHSPSLVLSSDPDALWWMVDAAKADGGNQLRRAGVDANVAEMLIELYDPNARSPHAASLLATMRDREYARFIGQCTQDAADGVDEVSGSEQQITTIVEALEALLAEHERVHYLDFGCGPGRCLDALSQLPTAKQAKLTVSLVDQNQSALGKTVAALRIKAPAVAIALCGQNLSAVGEIDYAVAANVFHELTGRAFVTCLVDLWNKLAQGGLLQVLDFDELPDGERGFLVLSRQAWRVLFGGVGAKAEVRQCKTQHGWPFVHVEVTRRTARKLSIPRAARAYRAAVQTTREECLSKLADKRSGRARAFWLENLAAADETLASLDVSGTFVP